MMQKLWNTLFWIGFYLMIILVMICSFIYKKDIFIPVLTNRWLSYAFIGCHCLLFTGIIGMMIESITISIKRYRNLKK